MTAPRHGKNGLIYIDGNELEGGNTWNLNISTGSVETPQFGDNWVKRVVGQNDWSGSVNAWEHTDTKVIVDAVTARESKLLLIYPDRDTPANYYSGNAIFGANADGSATGGISRNGDFVGDDQLTINGWT